MRVCSTRQIVVLSTSSVRLQLSKIASMTFLQLWTSLSHIPSKCGAPGWLHFRTIFFCAKPLSILALSHSSPNAFSCWPTPEADSVNCGLKFYYWNFRAPDEPYTAFPYHLSLSAGQLWRRLVLKIFHCARCFFWSICEKVKSQVCTSSIEIKSVFWHCPYFVQLRA